MRLTIHRAEYFVCLSRPHTAPCSWLPAVIHPGVFPLPKHLMTILRTPERSDRHLTLLTILRTPERSDRHLTLLTILRTPERSDRHLTLLTILRTPEHSDRHLTLLTILRTPEVWIRDFSDTYTQDFLKCFRAEFKAVFIEVSITQARISSEIHKLLRSYSLLIDIPYHSWGYQNYQHLAEKSQRVACRTTSSPQEVSYR